MSQLFVQSKIDSNGAGPVDTSASNSDLSLQTSTHLKSSLAELSHPRWIGQKFESDGKVMFFPGNTVICHLSTTSDLYKALLRLFEKLQQQTFVSLFALLPPESWHMTVFEGVSDKIRTKETWPSDLALDVPLRECYELFSEKLQAFDLRCVPPFQVVVAGWEPLDDGIAVKVMPASTEEESRLRHLRDRISDHLKVRHVGHQSYSFHISLAYTLRFLMKEDREATEAFLTEQLSLLPTEFTLGAPEFCIFDNMMSFQREFYLK